MQNAFCSVLNDVGFTDIEVREYSDDNDQIEQGLTRNYTPCDKDIRGCRKFDINHLKGILITRKLKICISYCNYCKKTSISERGDDVAIKCKKCPKCGSLNTIKILYGMPAHEAFLMAEQGRIKLGGCCITGNDPEYFCKDCNNEWDRQTAIDNAYNEIRGIKASVGGYFDGYYEVDIDFQSRKLKWNHLGAGAEDYFDMIIRQSTLERLIDELEVVDLLNWKSKYIESGICDGTQWCVEVIRNGRRIKKYGNNKFPDEWDGFCELIKKVSGKNFS